MKTIQNMLKITTFTCGLIISSLASATVIPPLLIDFRDAAWSGALGNNPFAVGAVEARAISAGEKNGRLYQDSTDGLGIMANPKADSQCGYEMDEIDTCEILQVTLEKGNYLISDVWITDLFGAPDGVNATKGERGRLKFNTHTNDDWSSNITFWGKDSDQANGELEVTLGGEFDVKSIRFWVPNQQNKSEFSVAGLVGRTVPEPTPLILMALAILGLGALRRK